MRSVKTILFLLASAACYLALALVVAGFGIVIVLSATGTCSNIGTGGINCATPWATSLGEFGLGVMLATVFTGIPAVLAIIGLVLLVRQVLRWRRGRMADAQPVETTGSVDGSGPSPPRSGVGKLLLKALGIFLAAAFVYGVVLGILEG